MCVCVLPSVSNILLILLPWRCFVLCNGYHCQKVALSINKAIRLAIGQPNWLANWARLIECLQAPTVNGSRFGLWTNHIRLRTRSGKTGQVIIKFVHLEQSQFALAIHSEHWVIRAHQLKLAQIVTNINSTIHFIVMTCESNHPRHRRHTFERDQQQFQSEIDYDEGER